jgi:hypothetical protein
MVPSTEIMDLHDLQAILTTRPRIFSSYRCDGTVRRFPHDWQTTVIPNSGSHPRTPISWQPLRSRAFLVGAARAAPLSRNEFG